MEAEPGLVRVMSCDSDEVPVFCPAKLSDDGVRVSAAWVPVPVRFDVFGELGELDVTTTVPERVPAAVGVKVTLMVQNPPGATTEGQLLV